MSVVGASRLGGEIAAMQQPVTAKVATFLGLAASLKLFLFLFNLLPVLPLDGGHIAGALYESVKRFIARVRGKPDPGPVDTARLLARRLRGGGGAARCRPRGHLGRPGEADHLELARGNQRSVVVVGRGSTAVVVCR